MITVWAGRLTPQASVAMQTRTWIDPSANSSSTNPWLSLDIPAWWMAKLNGKRSFRLLSFMLPSSSIRISWTALSGLMDWVIVSFSIAVSLRNLVVFAVSLREQASGSCLLGQGPFRSRLHWWSGTTQSLSSLWHQWTAVEDCKAYTTHQSRKCPFSHQLKGRLQCPHNWAM